jgi:hypothetical protein
VGVVEEDEEGAPLAGSPDPPEGEPARLGRPQRSLGNNDRLEALDRPEASVLLDLEVVA